MVLIYGVVNEARLWSGVVWSKQAGRGSKEGARLYLSFKHQRGPGKRVFDGSLSRCEDAGWGLRRGKEGERDRLHAAYLHVEKGIYIGTREKPMNLVVVSNRHSCEKKSRSGSLGQGGTPRAGAGLTFRAGQGTSFCGPGQGWVRTEIKSWDRGPFWQVGVWWDGAPHLCEPCPGPLCCCWAGCGNGEREGM